jgi:ribosome-associated protein
MPVSNANRAELRITADLVIPRAELTARTSRSGGPGGQNVNKVETRVELRFDVGASTSLSDEQRALVRARLRTRIGKDGVLRVVSQRERTQAGNRAAAEERLIELLRAALARRRPRRATAAPAAARRARERGKRRRAEVKRRRLRPVDED